MNTKLMQAALAGALVGGLVVAAAAGPLKGHPKLNKAKNSIDRALADCREAKAEDPGEFGGHRVKAEQFLSQAKDEIYAAAEYANHH